MMRFRWLALAAVGCALLSIGLLAYACYWRFVFLPRLVTSLCIDMTWRHSDEPHYSGPLVLIGEAAVPELLAVYGSSRPECRRDILLTLARIDGAAAVEGILGVARDRQNPDRAFAVRMLAGLRGKRNEATDVILEALGDNEKEVVRAAASASALVHTTEAKTRLLDLLTREDDAEILRAALFGMRHKKLNDEDVAILRRFLAHPNGDVRKWADTAIRSAKSGDSVDVDPNETEREGREPD